MPYLVYKLVCTCMYWYLFYSFVLIYTGIQLCACTAGAWMESLFCVSSSILSLKPHTKAAACVMLLSFFCIGTGRLPRSLCSFSKPLCPCSSMPSRNLLIASSISCVSGLPRKKPVLFEGTAIKILIILHLLVRRCLQHCFITVQNTKTCFGNFIQNRFSWSSTYHYIPAYQYSPVHTRIY